MMKIKKPVRIKKVLWTLPSVFVLLFLSLGYQQFYCSTSQPFVRLADHQQDALRQYQLTRAARQYEFRLQPRQSYYCAGRIYCVEQSAPEP